MGKIFVKAAEPSHAELSLNLFQILVELKPFETIMSKDLAEIARSRGWKLSTSHCSNAIQKGLRHKILEHTDIKEGLPSIHRLYKTYRRTLHQFTDIGHVRSINSAAVEERWQQLLMIVKSLKLNEPTTNVRLAQAATAAGLKIDETQCYSFLRAMERRKIMIKGFKEDIPPPGRNRSTQFFLYPGPKTAVETETNQAIPLDTGLAKTDLRPDVSFTALLQTLDLEKSIRENVRDLKERIGRMWYDCSIPEIVNRRNFFLNIIYDLVAVYENHCLRQEQDYEDGDEEQDSDLTARVLSLELDAAQQQATLAKLAQQLIKTNRQLRELQTEKNHKNSPGDIFLLKLAEGTNA